MPRHVIESVEPNGAAHRAGICAGDTLAAINGEPVRDQIDYQFLASQGGLTLEIIRKDGQSESIKLRGSDGNLGLRFGDSMRIKVRECANNCVFCFVNQLPRCMRGTLYVKDDDWRMSLIMGNYVTLTNVGEAEFNRIISRRASPLYISVHAMDSAVNARLLGRKNERGTDIEQRLRKLSEAGISFHCQIVLCPGINDGAVLNDTIERLLALSPSALSVAVVPVGLTKHRADLPLLNHVTEGIANRVIAQVNDWQKKCLAETGTRFVFASDEMYIRANLPLPAYEEYEDFQQVGNGVGLVSSFVDDFTRETEDFAGEVSYSCAAVTGVDFAPILAPLIKPYNIDTIPIVNRFFGDTVTVAGLLTAQDIAAQLNARGGKYDAILLCDSMLNDDGVFLDDWTLDDLRSAIGTRVIVVGSSGIALANKIKELGIAKS